MFSRDLHVRIGDEILLVRYFEVSDRDLGDDMPTAPWLGVRTTPLRDDVVTDIEDPGAGPS